jgi:hypothetical protein
MSKQILAAITAVAIAAGSIASSSAPAEAAAAPHYKPVYCFFFPWLCPPPVMKKAHVVKTSVVKKPMMAVTPKKAK